METVKRKRGRPRGSKDTRPRYRRSPVPAEILNTRAMTVEQKLKLLTRPMRCAVYAKLSGLSESLIRKRAIRGEIKAFRRAGLLLIEPADFLAYWNGARLPVQHAQKSPAWKTEAVLNLAKFAYQNSCTDKKALHDIADKARLLAKFVPESEWSEIEWIDDEYD